MDAPRKSNRQRREEIRNKRLARAEKAHLELARSRQASATNTMLDVRLRNTEGWVEADRTRLTELNNTYGDLPEVYLDTAFTCRDCGREEVWTARQQRWWYEIVGASIWSQAVRCRDCRSALRRQRVQPGANRLGEDVVELRLLAQELPDARAWERVEAGLASKWSGVRAVAMETLGHWRTDAAIGRLKTLAEAKVIFRHGHPGYQDSQALLRALAIGLREQDAAWTLARLDAWGIEAAWYLVPALPHTTLATCLSEAWAADDVPRMRCVLAWSRFLRDHSPLEPFRERIARHPDAALRSRVQEIWPLAPQS